VRYGATGTQVRVNSDGTVEAIMLTVSITATVDTLHFTNALPLGDGGTGATTASTARTNLGAIVVGANLFTAVNAGAGRAALGSTTVGDALFITVSDGAARSTLGLVRPAMPCSR
jgi:hypothetical protein